MDNETIAINLVTGYLVKNELPTADHGEQIVKQLTNFYKATMEELGSNDAKRQADRLKQQGRRQQISGSFAKGAGDRWSGPDCHKDPDSIFALIHDCSLLS